MAAYQFLRSRQLKPGENITKCITRLILDWFSYIFYVIVVVVVILLQDRLFKLSARGVVRGKERINKTHLFVNLDDGRNYWS
jgi:hypothetical protein